MSGRAAISQTRVYSWSAISGLRIANFQIRQAVVLVAGRQVIAVNNLGPDLLIVQLQSI
jgi:hypothetical protein